MNKYLKVIGALTLAALAGGTLYSHHRAKAGLEAQATRGMNEAQFSSFIADQKRLAALNIFPATSGGRDAGAVLNRWIFLDGGTPEERGPDEKAWWQSDEVFVALRCKESQGSKKPSMVACMDQAPDGDLSFMASLADYDTWDPSSSGAWPRYLAAHPREQAWAAAIPNYIPFQSLAKLRLIQGIKGGDPVPALSEVRQLARLTWSTETLVGAFVAVAMLSFERQAYDESVARGLIGAEAWTPVSVEDIAAYKRVLWSTQGVMMGLGPTDGWTRLEAAVPHPVGLCPASAEAALNMRMLRALFTDTWPGEIDLSTQLSVVTAVMSTGPCRHTFIGPVWADRTRDLDVLEGYGEEAPWLGLWARIPFARQALGGELAALATLDLNQYDEPDSP